jgi:hypothetical protein
VPRILVHLAEADSGGRGAAPKPGVAPEEPTESSGAEREQPGEPDGFEG